jgi:hypothetical protein
VSCQSRALGAACAADVEAVDPDRLAGAIDVDLPPWAGIARRLVGRREAGDQAQSLGAWCSALGLRPGWAIEKERIRSSIIFGEYARSDQA